MSENNHEVTDQGHRVFTAGGEWAEPTTHTQTIKEIHTIEKQISQPTAKKRSFKDFIKNPLWK